MAIEKKSLTGSGLGNKAKTAMRKTVAATSQSSITRVALASTRVTPRTKTGSGSIKVGNT
jgi:hypothetical protein